MCNTSFYFIVLYAIFVVISVISLVIPVISDNRRTLDLVINPIFHKSKTQQHVLFSIHTAQNMTQLYTLRMPLSDFLPRS